MVHKIVRINYDEIFCPSKKKCYFGGQMGDKMGDNLQISKLNKNRRNFKCLKSCDLQAIFAYSMLFFAKNHFPTQNLLSDAKSSICKYKYLNINI